MNYLNSVACQESTQYCVGFEYDFKSKGDTTIPEGYRPVDEILVFKVNGLEILSIAPDGAVHYRGEFIANDLEVKKAFPKLKK